MNDYLISKFGVFHPLVETYTAVSRKLLSTVHNYLWCSLSWLSWSKCWLCLQLIIQ